ncbi:MAG: hypothetical protein IJ901_10630 [Bacteroidaceae bacterium]|nr:hypothetical protein [Bacteroidaceae bacterium]
MTENQYRIADRVLLLLKEHGGRVNMDGLRSQLSRDFPDKNSYLDRELVFDRLEEHGLVKRQGVVLFTTWEGEKVMRVGMMNYEKGLGIIEWWKNNPLGVIVTSLIGAAGGSVVTYLLNKGIPW